LKPGLASSSQDPIYARQVLYHLSHSASPLPCHIIAEPPKIQKNEDSRERCQVTYKGKLGRTAADFSAEMLRPGGDGMIDFKSQKKIASNRNHYIW
jgi:hypothetical protein